MSRLRYLVREAGVALDIYLASRSGQDFSRAAFILADDCAELAGKLFLAQQPGWTDETARGRHKGFKTITAEVRERVAHLRPADSQKAREITAAMEGRRERRNGFFHSAHLLDLTLHARDCVEALTDMLDYGALLFPSDREQPGDHWAAHVEATANMATADALLRLDRRSLAEPAVQPKVAAILRRRPRIGLPPARFGCAIAHFPDDHHLRLAIRDGGRELRDQLRALLETDRPR